MEEAIEEVEESVRPKLVKAPEDPTQEEIDEHEATGHVIYRNWCRHCMGEQLDNRTEQEAKSRKLEAWCQLWRWTMRSCHAVRMKRKERNRS